MRVAGAREVWEGWIALRVVALDEENGVDETAVEAFDNEADAEKCWAESYAAAVEKAEGGDQ
jgi:hypothetical protein